MDTLVAVWTGLTAGGVLLMVSAVCFRSVIKSLFKLLHKKSPGFLPGLFMLIVSFISLFYQQKHSRPTGKVEVKIKVKITVCLCDDHEPKIAHNFLLSNYFL
jgi:hypothetical protein